MQSLVADEKLVRLHNLKELLRARQVEDRERAAYLVKQLGSSVSYWSGMLAGDRSFGERVARRIEEGLGLGRGHLDSDGHSPAPAGGAISIAQTMSESTQRMTPITIQWESVVIGQMPERFALVIRDEAMAPQFKPGHTVEFDSTRQAKPGDVVLRVDADGHAYLRDYVERRPGLWTAAPRSPAYQALDSVADGLRVLAVLVGHTWG